MPIIGREDRFAAQYELDPEHHREWLFGRFRFWVAGEAFGDYEIDTSLRDVLFQLEQGQRGAGRRKNHALGTLTASAIFSKLDTALFGAPNVAKSLEAEEGQWARHTVLPSVDVFDHCKAFVVGVDGGERLIYAQEPYSRILEILLDPGEVDAVLASCTGALRDLYDSEVGSRTV